ncbi:MAG: hypothetical protein AUF60_00095 [Gemmatimonadetes bacterium 13_1_20CM_69_28]|nr:MAG: hypothetical protein AUF60_00095 [Gemmatimonadetes bacterium 13_1_20CM_69_28]
MSQLLEAAAGVANACEPIPGVVTGGQPTLAHLAALKRAGCEVILDIREPMEPQPFRAAGPLDDATFDRVRRTVRELAGHKRCFFYCASGNRVGVTLLPYLMLDQGMSEDDAVTEAMRIGMRNAGLMQEALEYVRRQAL